MENFKEMTASELQEINGGFWALLAACFLLAKAVCELIDAL
jgi:lactobin A/cerein 7B family class IIb bacteriocin